MPGLLDLTFQLDPEWVHEFEHTPVEFGWGGMVGEVTFRRTYSSITNPKTDGRPEEWVDVVERVHNGLFSIMKNWCIEQGIPWDESKAQRDAMESFELMFNMLWTPPGRGLGNLGLPIIHDRGMVEAMQNCAFVSTKNLPVDLASPFGWAMEMSMLGVGVGFDTRGAGTARVFHPDTSGGELVHVVEDSRQGWRAGIEARINSFLKPNQPSVKLDVSQIRPKGAIISSFGKPASGPDPLLEADRRICQLLTARSLKSDNRITITDIVDIFNIVGVAVVSGNVRRSAEIALGPMDQEFLNLKDDPTNERPWKHTSNNSVIAEQGMDYTDVAERAFTNGEPGLFWLPNVQRFGRMNGVFDFGDFAAEGTNPCAEMGLRHKEMCTLVETYPIHAESKRDYFRALKAAYRYGKVVTLMSELISDPETRDVMLDNRRVGVGATGLAMMHDVRGLHATEDWLDHGYAQIDYFDKVYSQFLQVNESVRRTTVKPSGTTSLVMGTTPGVHFAQAGRYHIRRITLDPASPLVEPLEWAGYPVEQSVIDPNAVLVEMPVDTGMDVRSEAEVSFEDQMQLIGTAATHWSDNGVSATPKFDPIKDTPQDLAFAFAKHESQLKAISVLPKDNTHYDQAPYQSITRPEFMAMRSQIRDVNLKLSGDAHDQIDQFCDGEACEVPLAQHPA